MSEEMAAMGGEREKDIGRRPEPTRSEPDPVSVPENGDFRYDQANEAQDEHDGEAAARHPRKA